MPLFTDLACAVPFAHQLRSGAVAVLIGAALFSSDAPALPQNAAHPKSVSKANTAKQTAAEAALVRAIQDADAARNSKDPSVVATANQRLSGLALRELAQLRLLESAYPQAIELYRSSLALDDRPDTRIDYAIAEVNANRVEDAITQLRQVLAAAPDNPRANTALGRALMRKNDYPAAAEALARSVKDDPDIEAMYSLGICLLSTKNPSDKERAATVFEQMVEIAGESGSIHVLFGRAYRDAEDLDAAVREMQRAILIDPKTPHAHYFLGLLRLSQNEWKPTPEVKEELLKEQQNYPRDYLANYMLGFVASEERRYDNSNKFLRIAADISPDLPEPWLYLGLNAYAVGDMKVAEETLRKAVQLTGKDEGRAQYQIRRAYIDLGRILSTSGRKEEAEPYLAKAREMQNKTMAQSQQFVAQTAAAAGASDSAAIVALTPETEAESAPLLATDADPFARLDADAIARARLTPAQQKAAEAQESRLRVILGQSLSDLATSEAIQRQYGRALTHFQQADYWAPDTPDLAKNLGLCAYKVSDYGEAIRGFSRALEEKPMDAPVRALLGMSYFATDKFADAVRTFTPLGTRGMQDSKVGYAWATSLTRIANLKDASAVLGQFESQQLPNETLVLVGQLWTEIGDYQRAVEALRRASQSDPSLVKAHYYAGLAYLRWGHWPEAAGELQAELALTPNDPDARYNLGFVDVQQGKVEEGLTLFQQVIAAQPNYANAQYQVGKIMLDRGQIDDALPHLEVAARLVPQVDYVHYQLQSAYRKKNRTADADRELEIYKQLKAKSRAQAAVPTPTP